MNLDLSGAEFIDLLIGGVHRRQSKTTKGILGGDGVVNNMDFFLYQ